MTVAPGAEGTRVPSGLSHQRWLMLIAAGSLVVRFVWMFRARATTVQQTNGEMLKVATSLVTRGEFSDAFAAGPTGPSAHVAPLPTWIISLGLRAVDGDVAQTVVVRCLAVCAVMATLLLIERVGRALRLDPSTRLIACGLFGLLPIKPYVELNGAWDQPYSAAALAATVLASTWYSAGGMKAFQGGLLIGLSLNVTPVALIVAAGGIGMQLVRRRHELGGATVRSMLCMALGVTLLVLPWTIRNRVMMGEWFLMRDNFGLELAAAHGPNAAIALSDNVVRMVAIHPQLSKAAASQIRRVGEVSYNRALQAQAVQWIVRNPAVFARMTLARALRFWVQSTRWWWVLAQWGLLVGMLVGVLIAVRTTQDDAVVLAAAIAPFWLLYSLVQSDPRYGYPVFWAQCLLCAYGARSAYVRATTRSPGI